MMNEKEILLLRIIKKNMLIRKDELKQKLNGSSDGYEAVMSKLVSEGLVNSIDSIGSQCFALTQKGIRALDD